MVVGWLDSGWRRGIGAAIIVMGLGATGCPSEDDDNATATSVGEATGTQGGTGDAATQGSTGDTGTSGPVDTSSSSGEVPECTFDVDCPDSELGAVCRMGVCLPAPACAFNGDRASCMAAACIWDVSCLPEGKCCGDVTEADCGCM